MFTCDEKVINDAIMQSNPEFKDSKLSFNHNGWSSVVVDVDGVYICKFPRNEQKYQHLQREHELIHLLKKNISDIEFPDRAYCSGEFPFFVHKKLQGDYFPLDSYLSANKSQRHAFEFSVVNFLVQMHELNVDEFSSIIPLKNEKLPKLDELCPVLEYDLSGIAYKAAVEALEDFNDLPEERCMVVGHYDMHGYNLVVDSKKKSLRGVFDFDEVAIGSIEFDLRELPLNYNLTAGYTMIDLYNQQAKRPVDRHTLDTIHTGWCLNEYVRTKRRLQGDLKDVNHCVEISEYKREIEGLLLKPRLEI